MNCWQCTICGYVMTEEQSKMYRSCPSGVHWAAHIPHNDTGDDLYNASKSVILHPGDTVLRENLANALNRYDAARQSTHLAWLRVTGKG